MRALPLATLALTLALAATAPAGARHERLSSGTRQCISLHAIRDETAETDDRLIFHGGGGTAWRNRLPQECENLRRINNLNKLKLRSTNGEELCEGDTVEMVDHDGVALGLIGGGPAQTISCKLGQFEPISEMTLPENIRR
ncbi:MAG TPA: hypothetical protein VKQ09_02235 [Sphingomonas sp.]|jgi:hypothetical protein|nr:hypothetical protein [Sphingomonas sp.]